MVVVWFMLKIDYRKIEKLKILKSMISIYFLILLINKKKIINKKNWTMSKTSINYSDESGFQG